MKMNRNIALALMAAVMLLTACQNGGSSAEPSAPAASSSAASSVSSASTVSSAAEQTEGFDENGYWIGEPVEIRMLVNGQGDTMNDMRPSRVAQELIKRTGVDIVYEQATQEKFALLIASGDLPDILHNNTGMNKDKEALITSGSVIPLGDLIDQYGAGMVEALGAALDISRKNWSLGQDEIYYVPLGVGTITRQNYPLWIRWDLYKDLGAPPMTGWQDYLDVMKQMRDKNPTTADGLPVYGYGGFIDWGIGWFTYAPSWWQIFGYHNVGYGYISYEDNSLIMAWDEKSPEWEMLKIASTANQMGLIDPDSPIQTWADWVAKRNAGQYLSSIGDYASYPFNADHVDEDIGYEPIPLTGGTTYADGHISTNVAEIFVLSVSKNCKDPAAAMRWINYVCS
jgi:hypothetical protein